MAYGSDLMNWFATKRQRDRAPYERFDANLKNISDMLFAKRESEKEREFTGQENEKTRTYQDTPFSGGPREYTDKVSGQTFSYETPREYDALLTSLGGALRLGEIEKTGEETRETAAQQQRFQEDMQQDAQAFEKELAGIQNEAAMERMSAQIQADIDAAERAWEQPREQYEEQSATVGGRLYSWSSDQEYELQALKMQQDMINDRIRLEASLRDEDEDSRTAILDAYEFGRNEVLSQFMNPDGTWKEGVTEEALKEAFMKAVGIFEALTPEQAQKALAAFEGWLANMNVEEGSGEGEAGDRQTRLERHGLSTELAATPGIAGIALNMPLDYKPGEAEGERVSTTPRQIDAVERPFYDQLMAFIKTQPAASEARSEAEALKTRIETETMEEEELGWLIDELLSQVAQPRQSTFGNTFRPIGQ